MLLQRLLMGFHKLFSISSNGPGSLSHVYTVRCLLRVRVMSSSRDDGNHASLTDTCRCPAIHRQPAISTSASDGMLTMRVYSVRGKQARFEASDDLPPGQLISANTLPSEPNN